ncbi:hypothetical protein V6N11_042881 [Hibiscus sabdariffa]|uniref:Uncharacterized protein n=1 Tax=Hibiscus sabdariffa TaxID=183260 RepID=A0ABR2QXL4_9ROSI
MFGAHKSYSESPNARNVVGANGRYDDSLGRVYMKKCLESLPFTFLLTEFDSSSLGFVKIILSGFLLEAVASFSKPNDGNAIFV